MTPKAEIGHLGEEIACRFLVKHGFRVRERNYWKKWGELDVIAEKGDMLRFVEVKTMACEYSLDVPRETVLRPEDNMHPKKIERLHRAIQTYLLDRHIPEDMPWQLDLLAIELNTDTKQARCRFLENVA